MSTMRIGAALLAAAAAGTTALADVNDLRDFYEVAGFGPQNAANAWCVRYGGPDGALLGSAGSYFSGPYDHGTPIFGPLLAVGDYAGWWHGATFEGLFVHSGPGISLNVQRNFAEATTVRGLTVDAEMVLNGSGGNGLSVDIFTIIGGVRTHRGGFAFDISTPETAHAVDFGADVAFGAGDRLEIVYGDAGSYLYDHANTNVRLNVVPGPGVLAVLGVAVLGRRRR